MAGIDKIYGTSYQWGMLRDWLKANDRYFLIKGEIRMASEYLYDCPDQNKTGPLSNFPAEIDAWLLNECHLKWLTDRIKEQYGLN